MNEFSGTIEDGIIELVLQGRIDSNNASQMETLFLELTEGKNGFAVHVDASKLEYISSAGLRVLLHLKKTNPEIKISNVCPDVYEIFEMTGFIDMMKIEKAYRKVSIDGAEEIGRGANGIIYRIDQDNVVKVYSNPDALSDIQHEREVARLALVLGIPTAISYDVVQVEKTYGSVFELLNARSFSNIISSDPDKLDWCVGEYVKMLKKIHSTRVPVGKLPDIKETALNWADFMKDYLPESAVCKLIKLINSVPHDDHMIHGDYHTKNLELQGDEVILIDMDTLAVGHPVFELASMFNSFIGYGEYDNDVIRRFLGFDFETSVLFLHKALSLYLGTDDENKITEVLDKARVIGYTRMIRRSIRRKGLETEDGRNEIELWKNNLLELLEKTDTLVFTKDPLDIEAESNRLNEVLSYIRNKLEGIECKPEKLMDIDMSTEEIFVNVANYAYAPGKGNVLVNAKLNAEKTILTIVFSDRGKPFNPLEKKDPDITLSAEKREIGGLGIYMTKKMMDEVCYEYKDGQNILTLRKKLFD